MIGQSHFFQHSHLFFRQLYLCPYLPPVCGPVLETRTSFMPYAPETHWSIPRRPIARKPHLIYDSQEENQRETLLPFPKPARMSDDLFRTFFMPALFLPHPQNLPDSYSIRQVLNHYIVCSRYAYWLSPFVHFKIETFAQLAIDFNFSFSHLRLNL